MWDLFHRAMAVAPGERGTLLSEACHDETLRGEVERLLSAYGAAPSVLDILDPEPDTGPARDPLIGSLGNRPFTMPYKGGIPHLHRIEC